MFAILFQTDAHHRSGTALVNYTLNFSCKYIAFNPRKFPRRVAALLENKSQHSYPVNILAPVKPEIRNEDNGVASWGKGPALCFQLPPRGNTRGEVPGTPHSAFSSALKKQQSPLVSFPRPPSCGETLPHLCMPVPMGLLAHSGFSMRLFRPGYSVNKNCGYLGTSRSAEAR